MIEVTYDATDKMITKAYRNMALRFHPDKLGDKMTEKDKEVWLVIQQAYETLMDPAKRRKYDSSLPFDEKIPEEGDWANEEEFYDQFTKCFNLNMRWSKKQPTPNFGTVDMPLANVKKFYKFWEDFQTWREFSQYDEYDTDEAQDRYEKRYMQAENRRKNAKYVRAERGRINRLVQNAYDHDPRIQAELQIAEAETQRKKDEYKQKKIDAAKAKTDLVESKRNEAAALEKAKGDEKANAAALKKATDIAYKKVVKEFTVLCAETLPGTNYDRFWIEGKQRSLFQNKEKVEVYMAVLAEIQGRAGLDTKAKIEAWTDHIQEQTMTVAERAALVLAKAAEEERKQKVETKGADTEWTKEQVADLTKAILKFPPGTGMRWKTIAEFCGFRNQKAVIKKAQELRDQRN